MMNTKKNVLVTGGAGFIGSNLVKHLLNDKRVDRVRVFDNLSTGFMKNIEEFMSNPRFDFFKGDIRDFDTCMRACEGMDLITHQAALGSVPRSINDPLTTNDVNITGTLNVFYAAVKSGIDRVIFAASSSTYGDSVGMPKVEHKIGNPLSPYATTKLVNEIYAKVFSDTYKFKFIGLRYFNIFGPNQSPKGAYAAVIPLFMKAALDKEQSTINGDGSFSRDFTYVDNAVQANLKALFTDNEDALNNIYNIAVGDRTSLNDLHTFINDVADNDLSAIYGPERPGDVPHSLADISKAKRLLGYSPEVTVKEGINRTYKWFVSSVPTSA